MGWSSRERMLAALNCQPVDFPPCCFLECTALEVRCRDQIEMVERELELGLDAVIQVPPWLLTVPGDARDLRGLPMTFHPDVRIRERVLHVEAERYPVLHKEYITPAGSIEVSVRKTDDWPYGDHVPLADDYLVPRLRKPLIRSAEDLRGLRYLLMPPSAEVIEGFRVASHPLRQLARKHGLLVTGGTGIGADMAAWLCGIQNLALLTVDAPDVVAELFAMIADWNRARMEVVLDEGIDLWVRRSWYEGAGFWSPKLYRQFVLADLKEEVALAHTHGAKVGYIITQGAMPLLKMILEAGVDCIMGLDPLKGGSDLKTWAERAGGRICLWGGLNSALTLEQGSEEEVWGAVQEALDILGPHNGFILAPDEVSVAPALGWQNVLVMIEAWKEWRRTHGS